MTIQDTSAGLALPITYFSQPKLVPSCACKRAASALNVSIFMKRLHMWYDMQHIIHIASPLTPHPQLNETTQYCSYAMLDILLVCSIDQKKKTHKKKLSCKQAGC